MTQTQPPFNTPDFTPHIQSLQDTLILHQAPLATLHLTAYAIDAMRVLQRLERHADTTPAFHQAIRQACPDWRNPGAFHDPADLLTEVMAHALGALQQILQASADQLTHLASMADTNPPTPHPDHTPKPQQ